MRSARCSIGPSRSSGKARLASRRSRVRGVWERTESSSSRAPVRLATGTRVMADSSAAFFPAAGWLGDAARGPALDRYAEGLLRANAGVFRALEVTVDVGRQRGATGLAVRAGTRVGAIPLRSPTSGRTDFGLVVSPRFSWLAIGESLGVAGFRVTPEVLPLPTLPQSERSVPPWVLASVVLARMEELVRGLTRRFVTTEAVLPAPRGRVDIGRWATSGLAAGRPLAVPCAFPDLREDERLRAAVHWVVRRQIEGLRGAGASGAITPIRPLIERAQRILAVVAGTPPVRPAATDRDRWLREPLASRVFRDGLEAIGWTADQRGLAGLADTTGLSWRLDMERFFEAWVEAIAESLARQIGGTLRAGRTEATRVPLDWSPRGHGGLRSLLPDLVLSRPGHTIVVDAKYKPHGEVLAAVGRDGLRTQQAETHRADVHQALSYSTLFAAERVTAVLAYPARLERWQALVDARSTHARTPVVATGGRRVDLVVCALPLGASLDVARAALGSAVGLTR
jgi:hypothetical protein